MKLGANNCPDCGNLYAFTHGLSSGVACRIEECQVGYCTTQFPEIALDETEYTCYVACLPADWIRAIAWMANRFNIPSSQLRKHKDNPSLPLLTRKARELVHLRSEFADHGIEVRIEPEFSYSASDLSPHHERPLTDEDALSSIRELIENARQDASFLKPPMSNSEWE